MLREDVRHEAILELRLRTEQPNHVCLRDDKHLCVGHRRRAVRPFAATDERLLTQERAGVQETANPILAAARRHGQPHPTFFDVHHAIARVTLEEDRGSRSVPSVQAACASRGKKRT